MNKNPLFLVILLLRDRVVKPTFFNYSLFWIHGSIWTYVHMSINCYRDLHLHLSRKFIGHFVCEVLISTFMFETQGALMQLQIN